MSKDKNTGEVMLVVAANVPSLSWKVLRSYMRMKSTANRSARSFYRTMIANGMPKHQAKMLADEYASAFSLRTIISSQLNRRG